MEDNNRISNGSVNWLLFFNIILYVIITEVVIVINSYINYDEPDTYITRIIIQLFAILLPVIVFSQSKKINIGSFFRIKGISLKNTAIIVGLGFCAQFIGVVLKLFVKVIFAVFKVPYSVDAKVISVDSGTQIVMAVIALVILPALAEEFLFRGLVLRSYERWGTQSAIVITSLLFGLLHLDISSMLATVFMGLLLAHVVVKTDSLMAGILLHLVNNGTALLSMIIISKISSQFIVVLLFIVAVAAFFPLFTLFNKNNVSSKYIPQKRPLSSEITRTIFTLPILLSIMAFIIIQLYIFDIF